ncbi:MAG TPA: hypothetical protein VIL36_03055 [Acidimicrobiales bacterium]
MSIIRSTRDWLGFVAYAWREARRDDEGGVTDDVAMIGLMAAAAVGVGAFLGPWLLDKISTIDVGW